MICSSLNRLFLIARPPWAFIPRRTHISAGPVLWEQVKPCENGSQSVRIRCFKNLLENSELRLPNSGVSLLKSFLVCDTSVVKQLPNSHLICCHVQIRKTQFTEIFV